MILVGMFWSGPVALSWYWFVNPWYLSLMPRLFPRVFGTNFGRWRKIFVSLFMDNLIFSWALCSLKIFLVAAIGSGGDLSEGVSGVKQRLWPTVYISWTYYPFIKLMIYSVVP